jgi:hypothetical protein
MTQTAQEIHAVAIEWIYKHCPIELKTVETGGLAQPDVALINNFLQEHCGGVWSIENLNRAVDKLRDQLTWRSKADLEYSTAWASLNPDQQAQFTNWWTRQAKQYVQIEGEEGFINASRIITWCKGRTFTPDVFDRAVTNLFATQGLFAAPTKLQRNPRQHEDSGSFMPKENTTQFRGGKLNHAYQDSNQKKSVSEETAPDAWKQLAENLRGSTHSETETLKSINGKSWRETYMKRRAFLDNKNVGIFNPRAI